MSAASGFDHLADTRGLAAMDWDHDGDLDVWLSNRTSPRLRFLRNEHASGRGPTALGQHYIAFRLRGVSCNRDAIGARVTIRWDGDKPSTQAKTLRAGEGYLSQTSKWLHFGLGGSRSVDEVEIRWPDGKVERIRDLKADRHLEIVQGSGQATAWQRPQPAVGVDGALRPNVEEPIVRPIRILPHRRLALPTLEFSSDGQRWQRLQPAATGATLVLLWATWCEPCLQELSALAAHQDELRDSNVTVIALCADDVSGGRDRPSLWGVDAIARKASQVLHGMNAAWDGGVAHTETVKKLDVMQRVLVSRERPLSIPSSMLLDSQGRLAVLYKGHVPLQTLIRDATFHTRADTDTRDAAVPMPGQWYVNPVPPDLAAVAEKLLEGSLPTAALDYLDQHLLQTVQGDPANASVWEPAQIADLYLRTGIRLAQQRAHQQAEHALETAIELSPNLLAARAAMASLLETQLRYDEALAHYEELRQLQPNNPVVLNNIAWILVSSKDANLRDAAEAIRIAEQACQITNYRLPPALDTLAAAYAADGRFQDAVDVASRALKLAQTAGNRENIDRLTKKLNEFAAQAAAQASRSQP